MLKGERAGRERKMQKPLWLEKKPNEKISRRLSHLPPQQSLEEQSWVSVNKKAQPGLEFNHLMLKVLLFFTPP